MKNYLLVTIGPVQSYISQSRKTIDFFNSSRLIGEILKRIVKEIEPHIVNNEIILPNNFIEKYNEANSIPNYFIIELKHCGAGNIEEEVRKYYNKVFEELVEKIDDNYLKKKMKDMENVYKEHISDIFDIYPIKVEASNYKEAYEMLYEKLNKLKNVRIFKHYFTNGEAGKKCTICGERNQIFYGSKYNLSKKEGLCFSCYIKRSYFSYYNRKEKFPSTAEIAAMGWKNKIEEGNQDKVFDLFLDKIKDCLGNSDICEKLYYKEDLLNAINDKDKLKKCEQIYEKYKGTLYSNYKPTKYYALIKADIDDLGKWMSGKYQNRYLDLNEFLKIQKKISNKMTTFAESVEKYFADNSLGKAIYTGGDDFLLFVTLEELFNVLKFLDEGIKGINNALNYSKKLTMSKSITIAHYTTPLEKVIDITRVTLDNVKDKFEESELSRKTSKNGIGITFITRSNTYRTTMFKNCKNISIDSIKSVVSDFKEKISKSFINQLETNLSGLDEIIDYGEMLNMKKVFKSEVKRLLNRKMKENKDSNIKGILMELLNQSTIKLVNNSYELDYRNVFNFLHISDNISRELFKEGLK